LVITLPQVIIGNVCAFEHSIRAIFLAKKRPDLRESEQLRFQRTLSTSASVMIVELMMAIIFGDKRYSLAPSVKNFLADQTTAARPAFCSDKAVEETETCFII
jgi:hypothetical protein